MGSEIVSAAPAPQSTATLKRGVVGLVGAATLGAIMMSPALGLYGNWGPLAQDVGVIGPLIFVLGLFIALPTAISYAVIARVMPSSGSAYTWLWRSLTPAAGIWMRLDAMRRRCWRNHAQRISCSAPSRNWIVGTAPRP